jgi:hypothetical protein
MQYEKKLSEHSKYTNKHTHTNSRKVVNLSVYHLLKHAHKYSIKISNLKLQGTLLRNFHKNHDIYLPRHNTQKTTQQNCRWKSEIVKKYPDKFCEMVANLVGK